VNGNYTRASINVFLLLAGLFLLYGLSLWIVAFLAPGSPYPGRAHADVLTSVYSTTALLAVLFYALPRHWCVPGLRPLFIGLFLLNAFALFVSASISPPVALSLFVMLNSGALVFVVRRIPLRAGARIGSYTYVIIALLASISGGCLSLLVALDSVGESWWFWRQIADGIQFLGAPVLLLIGLSGQLLNPQRSEERPDTEEASPYWLKVLLALAFLLTFFLGAKAVPDVPWYLDSQHLAYVFRALFFGWIALTELNPFASVAANSERDGKHESKPRWRYAKSIYFTLGFMFFGMLLPAIWMEYRIAFEHMIFVGGYVWFVVALISEALFGGETSQSNSLWFKRKKQRNWFVVLMFLGLSTRVTSDIWTGSRPFHLAVASLCVIAALIIWGRLYWKLFREPEA
jgi:hypothetical protein